MKNAIKQFFTSKSMRRSLCLMACVAMLACVGVAASAEEPSAIVNGVQTVTDAVTSEFSITTIASIIGIVLAACVGLFLFWWGARKVVRMITAAFKSGKISL